MTALLIIDLQKEFLTADGMFGERHIRPEAVLPPIKRLVQAARNQRLAHGMKKVKVVWIRSEYDPLVKAPKICRPVGDPTRTGREDGGSTHGIPTNSDYLAGTHMASKRSCCAPGTDLADFHPEVLELINGAPIGQNLISSTNSSAGNSSAARHVQGHVDSSDEFVHTKTYYSAFSETNLNDRLKGMNVENVVVCGLVANVCVQSTAVEAWRHGYNVTVVSDATGASSAERHEQGLRAVSECSAVCTSDQIIQSWARSTSKGDSTDLCSDSGCASRQQFFKVVIVGAGVGGLACAIALHDRLVTSDMSISEYNFEIRILERDASLDSRAQGYSLTIQDGMVALDSINVGARVRSEVGGIQRSGQHIIDAKSGKVLLALGGTKSRNKSKGKQANARANARNIYLPRERLRRILYEKALEKESVSIEWDKRIVEIWESSEVDTRLQLLLSDGSTISEVDLVVAGDGARSELRQHLLPDKLNFLGVISICGINKTDHPLCINGSVQVFDPSTNSRLFSKPFDDCSSGFAWDGGEKFEASVMWQLTTPMEEQTIFDINALGKDSTKVGCEHNTNPEKSRLFEIVESIASTWDHSISAIVLSTPLDKLRGGGLYDRDPSAVANATDRQTDSSQWRSRGRVAFLGDAAHPMSPFKGQGANQALLDAIELADAVGIHFQEICSSRPSEELTTVLRRYHIGMSARVSRYVLGSRKNVQFTHADGVGKLETLFPHFGVRDYRAEQSMRERVLEVNQKLFPARAYAKEEDIFERWVHENIDARLQSEAQPDLGRCGAHLVWCCTYFSHLLSALAPMASNPASVGFLRRLGSDLREA